MSWIPISLNKGFTGFTAEVPKNAALSDILLVTTRWKKSLEQLQHVKDNSRSNDPMAVLTAHGVSCMHEQFHGLQETTLPMFTHILARLPSLLQTATGDQASGHSQGCNQNWKITTNNSYHRISHMLFSKLNQKCVYFSTKEACHRHETNLIIKR